MQAGVEMAEMLFEGGTEALPEAEVGLRLAPETLAPVTSLPVSALDAAAETEAIAAARTSAAKEAEAAAKSLAPESLKGTTSSAAGRSTNYFGAAPMSKAEAVKSAIVPLTQAGVTAYTVIKTNEMINKTTDALSSLFGGVGDEAARLRDASEELARAASRRAGEGVQNAEDGVNLSMQNAQQEFNHALEKAESSAALSYEPAKKVIEVSIAVVASAVVLYTGYKSYRFIKFLRKRS